MLRSAIICPDRDLARELQRALQDLGGVFVVRTIDCYPTAVELTRFVRAHSPEVIFLSIEAMAKVADVMRQLEQCSPGVQIIAIGRSCDPAVLLELMRAGIREFAPMPFDLNALAGAVKRASEALERKPVEPESSDLVYCFLPSKAGVGTSTIAMNTAVALSRMQDVNTLLSDFDLNSGMMRFMFKLDNPYSVTDAAERAIDIDEAFWPKLVTSLGRLDVLHAGKLNPNFRMEPMQIRSIVDFARRNYNVICADLSGNLEKYSIELMHESKRVYLVCTPEIPSLHLAREKYQHLCSLDLGTKITVLLNRHSKRNLLSPAQVQDLLGLPIAFTFPNDYHAVNQALTEGKPVEFTSEFSKQCTALAMAMLEHKAQLAREKKRFIEFFTIAPARGSIEGRKSNA